MTTLANLGLGKTTTPATAAPVDPASAPIKDTEKPSESIQEGDVPQTAAAKLGDERADAETKTVEENAEFESPKTAAEQADEFQSSVDAILGGESITRWSSHPIMRFTIGDYQFENGLLVLKTPAEAEDFQAMYDTLPISEKTRMRKLDLAAAEAIARQHIANQGGATQGIDSSTGERQNPDLVGKGTLGES